MSKQRVWWGREFKLAAIARMETAPALHGLAAELGIRREMLLKWRRAYEAGGASDVVRKTLDWCWCHAVTICLRFGRWGAAARAE